MLAHLVHMWEIKLHDSIKWSEDSLLALHNADKLGPIHSLSWRLGQIRIAYLVKSQRNALTFNRYLDFQIASNSTLGLAAISPDSNSLLQGRYSHELFRWHYKLSKCIRISKHHMRHFPFFPDGRRH